MVQAYNTNCASGADGINISICAAIISSSGRPNAISKRANNQLFILHSADGSGRRNSNIPPAQSPGRVCDFIMTRLIFTVYFLLLLISNAVGQNTNASFLVKKFDLNLLMLKQKLITDSLIDIYGNISDPELNKILNDTSFINSVILPSSHSHDQLICSTLGIPFILKPLGWTSDYGHIFTDYQIEILDSMLSDFEKKTSNEIAVVTFDSSFIHEENFDSLVLAIHDLWGVGKIDRHNGILIGICTAKRKIRIDNGSGIVLKLSNEETKEIIDNIIVPAFKKGDYFI